MATHNMFLVRGLQKILDEREIARNPQVRSECQKALDEIKAETGIVETRVSGDSVQVQQGTTIDVEKYFYAFQLACTLKHAKIQCIALDVIQKLLAYGHLQDSAAAFHNDTKKPIDTVIDTICSCFVGDHTDQTVALQIIKALLTAVTAPGSDVHEGSLLKAVRTCYNIHLSCSSLVLQTTAKATLTQMLNIIFQRMEVQAATADADATESDKTVLTNEGEAGLSTRSTPIPNVTDGASSTTQETRSTSPSEMTETVEEHNTQTNESKETGPGQLDNGIVTKENTNIPESEPISPLPDLPTESVAKVVEPVSSDEPAAKNPETKMKAMTSPGSHLSMESTAGPQSNRGSVHGNNGNKFDHVCYVDAYIVFRSLCKLSMKDVPASANALDLKSHEMRNKILSLELLLVVLQSSGPYFQNAEQFIAAVKQYLCISLSKNGVSSVTQIFELSLSIFLSLLAHFKIHIKPQTEVFFKDIFLPILETSTSSFHHKWMVLQSLSRIFADPQTLVDIYLNYDCDFSLDNLFGHMISDIAKIAQERAGHELGLTEQQEQEVGAMRTLAMECLAICLHSMVEWVQARDAPDDRSNRPTSFDGVGPA
eukprot:Ihof_evm1s30 gene=Ihof_evmTU1s30